MLMTIWTHLMATMVGACIGMFLMCCLIAGKEDEDEKL